MGTDLHINSQRIAKHGDELKNDIAPKIEKVRETLNADNIYNLEGGDFSITCTMASMAYPGALQFVFEDMETHKQMMDGFVNGIGTTAKTYQAAEDANKVK
ncbi:MAG TPA: hypothetical protein VGP70_25875 [Actinomadura sp.]|jgi:hypothetical protein|nr:hypothetical protein [Actinomadura sp.]